MDHRNANAPPPPPPPLPPPPPGTQQPGEILIHNQNGERIPSLFRSFRNYRQICAYLGCTLPAALGRSHCCRDHRSMAAANLTGTWAFHYLGGFISPADRNRTACFCLYHKRRDVETGVPFLEGGNIFSTPPWELRDVFTTALVETTDWLFFSTKPETLPTFTNVQLKWKVNRTYRLREGSPNEEVVLHTVYHLRDYGVTDREVLLRRKHWNLHLFESEGIFLYCLSHHSSKIDEPVVHSSPCKKHPKPSPPKPSPPNDSPPPPSPQGSIKPLLFKRNASGSWGVSVKKTQSQCMNHGVLFQDETWRVCWGKQLVGRELYFLGTPCGKNVCRLFKLNNHFSLKLGDNNFSEDPWVTTVDYIRSQGLLSIDGKATRTTVRENKGKSGNWGVVVQEIICDTDLKFESTLLDCSPAQRILLA